MIIEDASIKVVWDQCLRTLQDSLEGHIYHTWVEPMRLCQVERQEGASVLHIEVPGRYHAEHVRYYSSRIANSLEHLFGTAVSLEVIPTKEDLELTVADIALIPAKRPPRVSPSLVNWNVDQTFNNLIEGDCNMLARRAAMAIAEEPGATRYNPLFIHGGSGLGKTHLANAIANGAHAKHPGLKILFKGANDFIRDFVSAVSTKGGMIAFLTQYRAADVLILDDIQFLKGKEKTQHELKHLIDAHLAHGKQVVVCADRTPSDYLFEGLASRLQAGLTVDVRPPGLETRMAIVSAKASRFNLKIDADAVSIIARSVSANVRALEGAIQKLVAHNNFIGSIEPSIIDKILGETSQIRRRLTPQSIISEVASEFGVEVEEIIGRRRTKNVVLARHIAMYFCRTMTTLGLHAIGLHFGGRDHSSVINAVRKTEERLESDEFRAKAQVVRTRLEALVGAAKFQW